jgi:hypothetical protein
VWVVHRTVAHVQGATLNASLMDPLSRAPQQPPLAGMGPPRTARYLGWEVGKRFRAELVRAELVAKGSGGLKGGNFVARFGVACMFATNWKGLQMDRDGYELFEFLPDRSLSWRGYVRGLRGAQARVWKLADEVGTECFAVDPTGTDIVLARTPLRGAKRIFQIAYSTALAARAHLLLRNGYDVTSVSGNQVAQFVLQADPPYDLFVLGHGASQEVRTQMAAWLRSRYPNVRVVALNARGPVIEWLRFNAPNEPASAWLLIVSAAFREHILPGSVSR